MATKIKMENKDISYLGKDFNGFKSNLSNFARTYFPTMHNDFSAASPGTMFVEMASYVGDVLSYYMDSQLKESLLPYAKERSNVVALANTLGYVVKPTKASSTNLDMFIIIPANSNGAPDWKYAPTVQPDSEFMSKQGSITFTNSSNVDFQFSSSLDPTDATVYKINTSTSLPSYFLLKKQAVVSSGERETSVFSIGAPERYKKIEIAKDNVIEVESVRDSDNNTWSEVPYLAQETLFQEVANTSTIDGALGPQSSTAPYLLKLKKTSKRFITRTNANNRTEIVFGSGISTTPDEVIIPSPENVGNNTSSGVSKLDRAFDPSNFLQTKSYGQAPGNISLTVKYKTGGGQQANVAAATITKVGSVNWSSTADTLNVSIIQDIKNSLAVNNQDAAMGGASAETVQEIKRNALAYFQAQNRLVTKEDYIGRVYSMPAKYGNISKAYVATDTVLNAGRKGGKQTWDSDLEKYVSMNAEDMMGDKYDLQNPNCTNLYLLGYDKNKKLTEVNNAVKHNLKTYLTPYRMLTDAINIKNGFIINISVRFSIVPLTMNNSNEILLRCIDDIKKYFDTDNRQFNEPILISDLTTSIASVPGVQSVTDVKISNRWKSSEGYSGNRYSISGATKNEIIYPAVDPSIFELKFPSKDIKGKIITY